MFRIKYDMTEGHLRRVTNRTHALGRVHPKRNSKIRTADSSSGIASPMMAANSNSQRYSPVFDRAEDPTLAEDFLPADSVTQNKIFRNLMMFDAIAGPATEYWRDLAFSSNVILSGISDESVMQFYQDAIYASGIIQHIPFLLSDYLVFGKFVAHMLMDESKGYWTEVIPHDLDFLSIKSAMLPSMEPLIDIQPTQEQREWAVSADPRIVSQRRELDPVLVRFMAAGRSIPLAPENTIFMPRRVFSTDYLGTSYLTRILPFKIYEKALLDDSIAGARRRAGPVWHIKVPDDYPDDMMSEILDLFFAAEEDPIGGKVLTRAGVSVDPIGGGSADFWKLSDEWDFLSSAKMRALGVSEAFMSGEANWNTMEVVLSTFLEKIRAIRVLFTHTILIEKMIYQLAQAHGFVKRSEAELSHRIRTSGNKTSPSFRGSQEPEFLIPTIEWDKSLSPVADRDYMDILATLDERFPIPIRMWAQTGGFDIDKATESFESDLTLRRQIYEHKASIAKLAQEYGFDESGAFSGAGAGGAEDLGGLGGAGDVGGLGAGEVPEIPPMPGEEGGAGETPVPEAPAEAASTGAPAAPGALEGFGAGLAKSRFDVQRPVVRQILANVSKLEVVDDLIKELDKLPFWDVDDSLLGMTKRRVAKVLDRIDHSDPDRGQRKKLADGLFNYLRKKEGLTGVQASMVQYLAMRLNLVPALPLPQETYTLINNYLFDKVRVAGLNKQLTNELTWLSKVSELHGRKKVLSTANVSQVLKLLPKHERGLSDRYVLTGMTDLTRNAKYVKV